MATLAFAHTSGAEPVAGGRRRVGSATIEDLNAIHAPTSGFRYGFGPDFGETLFTEVVQYLSKFANLR